LSKPLGSFKATVIRAEQLIDLCENEPALVESDDLLRAAVTLAVAAYDHYFTSKFVDVLNSYLRNNKPNKELVDLLSRAGLNTESALEIAVMKRPFRRIRSLLQTSLGEKTTHRQKAIDGLFAAIELKGLSGRVHNECGRNNLGKRIDKLVETRNSIVHSGHLNTRGKPKAIDAQDTRNRIREIKLFIEATDAIIDDWVKGKPGLSSTSSTD